jgi:PAS domain S-box-containing protein
MATILIADDRPTDRELLVTLLGYRGHQMLEAGDGEAALAAVRKHRPSLVISDVMMPRMDGYELVRRIRDDPTIAGTPILFYSATYLPHELEALADSCGVRVLTKPSEPEAILAAVDLALEDRGDALRATGPGFQEEHLRLLTDKLVETQEELLLAIQGSNTAIWDWDTIRNVATFSPQWKSMLGYGTREIDASLTAWIDRVHAADRDCVVAAIEKCREGRAPSYEVEHRLRHKDGSYRWVLARGVARHDSQGRVTRLAGAHMDITRLKDAEAEALERARHAAFVADVAVAATEAGSTPEMLTQCADAIVRHLDAAFARIWTVSATEPVLILRASAGLYTHLDGAHARVPIGSLKIGRIAAARQPHLTNDIRGDSSVDQAWAAREGLVSFAGYPLVVSGRLEGVLALFARRPLSASTLEALASVARTIALGIERRQVDESRARFAAILEATPDFVTIGQPEGSPVFINRAARTALGIGADEHVDALYAFRKPDFQHFFETTVLPHATAHVSWTGETEYVARDGHVTPVSQVSIVHHDAQGRPQFVSTIARDISAEKLAQSRLLEATDALREAEGRMRFALDAAHVGVWEANLTTGAAYWSTTCEVMHGLQPGTFGRTLEAFIARIHSADRETVTQAIDQAIQKHTETEFEYRTVWPDRTEHWIHSTGRIVFDDHGAPVRAAGVAFDVTARRSLEEQLRQSQKMEGIGQLAGGIAHDFNNLLTVILGYSRLLLDTCGHGDPRRRDLEEIHKAGEQAGHLTQQLLAFSRKQIVQPVVLNLNELVADVTRLLGRVIGEHITLAVHLEPGPATIKADPGQIKQILVNLASNARDAMGKGGTLTVSTANVDLDEAFARVHLALTPGAYVALTVSDSGTGMDEATKTRIFEPFFTTKPVGKGTGMGLATVFGIVKQSGGSIWVYSEPGRGTSFKIYLPRVREGPAETLAAATDPIAPKGIETILVAEDDTAVRVWVEAVLKAQGYTVLAAANPEDALAVAADRPAALLLSDVVMPGFSGWELYERVRKLRPGIRALFMSGFADDATLQRAVLDTDTPFLQKPFTGTELARKVRDVLDRPLRGQDDA